MIFYSLFSIATVGGLLAMMASNFMLIFEKMLQRILNFLGDRVNVLVAPEKREAYIAKREAIIRTLLSPVPKIIFVALLIIAYEAIAATIFAAIEGLEWFDAFYYCYVTMSTIGYGDV